MLNVNGDVERFGSFGLPCIADSLTGYLGSLAGVLAALEYARERQLIGLLRSADTPFFPLISSLGPWESRPLSFLHQVLMMKSKWMRHPPLVSGTCRSVIFAVAKGIRKIVIWTDSVGGVEVKFAHASGSCDPFFNVNTREDLVVAQQEEQR